MQAQTELALSCDVVKNRVCDELDTWVLEPELIDLFDSVVSVGGRDAGFINELLDFACTFVDSKQRQLRLSAFALVNRMPQQTPRAKIAVLMRAYRKMPNKTYCPCPEGWWPREDMSTLGVFGAGAALIPRHVQVRSCGDAASEAAYFQGEHARSCRRSVRAVARYEKQWCGGVEN